MALLSSSQWARLFSVYSFSFFLRIEIYYFQSAPEMSWEWFLTLRRRKKICSLWFFSPERLVAPFYEIFVFILISRYEILSVFFIFEYFIRFCQHACSVFIVLRWYICHGCCNSRIHFRQDLWFRDFIPDYFLDNLIGNNAASFVKKWATQEYKRYPWNAYRVIGEPDECQSGGIYQPSTCWLSNLQSVQVHTYSSRTDHQ